ncbi:MAG: DUF5348 domain-containing protein [Lachnospiraceae bacterium]|nr:DUF5348 domain-containing protein [Lachnospiraceae bacterium]
MKGILVFNNGRPDIAYQNGAMHGGLHCGDCVVCLINGEWKTARVEYDDDWFFVCDGKAIPAPYGCKVDK